MFGHQHSGGKSLFVPCEKNNVVSKAVSMVLHMSCAFTARDEEFKTLVGYKLQVFMTVPKTSARYTSSGFDNCLLENMASTLSLPSMNIENHPHERSPVAKKSPRKRHVKGLVALGWYRVL